MLMMSVRCFVRSLSAPFTYLTVMVICLTDAALTFESGSGDQETKSTVETLVTRVFDDNQCDCFDLPFL
jgi:hypothetical protein